LLAELHPVAPETGSGALSRVAHIISFRSRAAPKRPPATPPFCQERDLSLRRFSNPGPSIPFGAQLLRSLAGVLGPLALKFYDPLQRLKLRFSSCKSHSRSEVFCPWNPCSSLARLVLPPRRGSFDIERSRSAGTGFRNTLTNQRKDAVELGWIDLVSIAVLGSC